MFQAVGQQPSKSCIVALFNVMDLQHRKYMEKSNVPNGLYLYVCVCAIDRGWIDRWITT